MNKHSEHRGQSGDPGETSPILVIPYMWIGDFVRGHTVIRVLRERWPNRPIDLLTTSLCAPLVDYMPGVRAGIVWDLPRGRLALAKQRALASILKSRQYRTVLVLPRTWKSALAPALAAIPERIGFVGEARFGLINRWRWGEKALPRFIDKNAALALPDGAPLPSGMARAATEGRRGRGRALARGLRPRQGQGDRAGAGLGRRVEALDLLSRGRAAPRRTGPRLSGSLAAPAKRPLHRRSLRPGERVSAISPAPTCAMAFWRWRQPMSRSPMIPA